MWCFEDYLFGFRHYIANFIMQHYSNELSTLPEGRLLVDLCTYAWGGYSAEADSFNWCKKDLADEGEWLKCNTRLGKALRFLSSSSPGCGENAIGRRHASCSQIRRRWRVLVADSRRRPRERPAATRSLESKGSSGSGPGTPYAQAGYAANGGASCSSASVGGGADVTRGSGVSGTFLFSGEAEEVYYPINKDNKEQEQT